MPKLVVYKKDIRALEQAADVCRIMAAHSPTVPEYAAAEAAVKLVLALHTEADDADEN